MSVYQLPFPADSIISYFGPRSFDGFHYGLDLGQPAGTPIKAPVDGVVVGRGFDAQGGYYVVWQSPDGLFQYAFHLAVPTPMRWGQRVTRGQTVLGQVGKTGWSAIKTVPHLHWEVRTQRGSSEFAINPLGLLTTTTPAVLVTIPFVDRIASLILTKRKKTPMTWLSSKTTGDCFRFFETTFDRRMAKDSDKAKDISRALGFNVRRVDSSVIVSELARLNERRAQKDLEPLTLDA